MNKKGVYLFLFLFLLLLFFAIVSSQRTSYGKTIETQNYKLSRDEVSRELLYGSLFDDYLRVENFLDSPLDLRFSTSSELNDFIVFVENPVSVPAKQTYSVPFRIVGFEKGEYSGEIVISGDINENLFVNLTVGDEIDDPLYLVDAKVERNEFTNFNSLKFVLAVDKLRQGVQNTINFSYYLVDSENNSYLLGEDNVSSNSSFRLFKKFSFPKNISFGYTGLVVKSDYGAGENVINSYFLLSEHILFYKIFGILPVWILLIFITVLTIAGLLYYLIKRHIEGKKKYTMELITKTLPKADKSFLHLGKIAESKIEAYLDPERMKTHTIVAGSTGGGKSISAQVIVEEVLMQNVAVVVFDPTAQWSGMLRKCDDKKMFNYYPRFGLKKTDARAFPGSIRMVSDAREIIDVDKHMEAGKIQIFAMNKLEPQDMDIFVANVIRQIFKNDPKETPDLKLLLVFDEVHRLLAKFGGSGEGFLQIERACREFRKWGIGVMLVSQVLNDFVGEIKANINTELQMRTRDEGDLKRISTKYGDEFLQSLVKASVGVGMFVNPYYNKGKPYFINFRPILHNTRRLSDEELEKYNDYNEKADDIEFQMTELEKLKVDVFDLKMELKLVKDKIMTGNFPVVDIYLQGLEPRIKKQWDKLGKTPPKRVKQMADMAEIRKSIEEAKKARAKFEAEQKKGGGGDDAVKEEKPDVTKKIVKSMTFENGIMVSSLDELLPVLPDIEPDIFAAATKKNEFSNFTKSVDEGLSKQLDKKVKKEEVVKIIQDWVENYKKSQGGGEEKKEAKEGEGSEEGSEGGEGEDENKEE